jgi:hypothetical protein
LLALGSAFFAILVSDPRSAAPVRSATGPDAPNAAHAQS